MAKQAASTGRIVKKKSKGKQKKHPNKSSDFKVYRGQG